MDKKIYKKSYRRHPRRPLPHLFPRRRRRRRRHQRHRRRRRGRARHGQSRRRPYSLVPTGQGLRAKELTPGKL